MPPRVTVERDGRVAVLSLDDSARRNAMTSELGDALRQEVETLRRDQDVRAVVLTGAGDAFSAGGDLKMLERLRSVPFDEARNFMLAFYGRYLSLTELRVPVIAAVRGPAVGAGLCVAMACDLMVVDEDAKLALNFVTLGLHPGMGATYLTPRRVGAQRAAELLLTGRRFTGKEAAAWGMALEAIPAAQVLPRAIKLAHDMSANAPQAVRVLKMELGLDRGDLLRALEHEARSQAVSYGSHDLGEGLKAASEKRVPNFLGN